MVRVEPFVYQMVTAFKERIQMVSKINEIIDIVNQDVGIDEVRAVVTEMLSDYYDKEEIDEMFDSIDFSPYYTKTEVNAIVDRIDGDVDAVEGRMTTAEGDIDALEGRMDTAEGDIDALETGKQNVLTAGDGIDITNDVVSLDNGWESITPASIPSTFDFDKYEYIAQTGFNRYYVFNLVGNMAQVLLTGGIVGLGNIGSEVNKYTVNAGKFAQFNISDTTGFTIDKAYCSDGTEIDANNIDTYIVSNVPNKIIHFAGHSITSVDYQIRGTFLPNETKVNVIYCAIQSTVRTVGGVQVTASQLYNCVKNGTNFNAPIVMMNFQSTSNEQVSTWYRKLR